MEFEKRVIESDKVRIDLNLVYEICGDDKDTLLKMIKIFTDTIPVTLEKLNLQYNENDWENLYKTAHSAKSSLSIVKIPVLYDWILTLEQNARQKKELNKIDALIPKINEAYTEARVLLTKTFAIG